MYNVMHDRTSSLATGMLAIIVPHVLVQSFSNDKLDCLKWYSLYFWLFCFFLSLIMLTQQVCLYYYYGSNQY